MLTRTLGLSNAARRRAHASRAAALALLALVAGGVAGCSGTPRRTGPARSDGAPLPPLPEYSSIAASYNARIAGLARLSSPVSVVIERRRDEGEGRTRDQLDGNLSIMPPSSTALRLDKAGVNAAYLGSNDFAYWWLDLSGSEPVALAGTHLKASRDDAADFGLPVHPLEFIELLGVLPLPAEPAVDDAIRWTPDGASLVVAAPSRWGVRRFLLDPSTMEPRAIELLDDRGTLAVGAALSEFRPAFIEGRPGVSVRVPTKVELLIPGDDTRVLLVLASPKVPLKINPRAFQLSGLIESYGVRRFVDQDARGERRRGEGSSRSDAR
jgi:hypothetical protein